MRVVLIWTVLALVRVSLVRPLLHKKANVFCRNSVGVLSTKNNILLAVRTLPKEKDEITDKKLNVSSNRYKHPQVYKMFHRAQMMIRNGDNFGAYKLLKRCIELNPKDSHSWLALARLEAKLGNIEKARELFSQSSFVCPNNIHILHAWGHMEQKHGNIELARDCWSKALKIDPLNAYVCHALSNLEKRLRNFDRAKEILEEVVKIKPTAALCVSLGELQRQLGNPEAARTTLKEGLKFCRSERSKLLLALAWIEEDAFDDLKEAEKLISQALAADKQNVRVYVAKAMMELRLGNVEIARETLLQATKIVSEDAQHYTMLSTLELEYGNIDKAREVLAEGAQKFPGDQFLLQRWGTLEAKFGNVKEARRLFQKSIEIQPHAPTFVAWAMLEESEGNLALDRNSALLLGATTTEQHRSIASAAQHKSVPDASRASYINIENRVVIAEPDMKVDPTILEQNGYFPEENNACSPDLQADLVKKIKLLSSPASKFISKFNNEKIIMTADTEGRLFDSSDDRVLCASTLEQPSLMSDRVLYCMHKLDLARQLFSVGMQVDPQHGPLYHAYGNMELRQLNRTGAREIFKKGIAANCSDIISLYHAWGLLEMKEKQFSIAREIFKKGIELGLNGAREISDGVEFLLHSLGMLELHDRKPEDARIAFSTGLQIFPGNSRMLLGIAFAFMKVGDYDRAREYFRSAVDADPAHLHAWQSWAIAEKRCGNIELARILFRQGLKNGPSHGALWQGFAVMEMQQGNLDIARTLFAQAIKRSPSHAQSYQAWACLEVKLGNFDKASSLAWQGIRRIPDHAALWTIAGLIELKLGNNVAAKQVFQSGIKRFPKHGALYRALGELESRQGNYSEARVILIKGLAEDPFYSPLYHSTALLEARLGNLENLSELHQRAKAVFSLSNSVQTSDEYCGETFDEDQENRDILEKIKKLEKIARTGSNSGRELLSDVSVSDSFIYDLNRQ